MKTVIYHNPRCSKSREALAILRSMGIEPRVVEYLKDPPTVDELRDIVTKLGATPAALVRTKEEALKGLELDLTDGEAVLSAVAKTPILLERPIVVHGSQAVIGRPPERVRTVIG